MVTYSLKFFVVRNASGRVIYAIVLCFYGIHEVTGHLSEWSFVRNVVVQIPKFDAKPTLTLTLTLTLALTLTLT